MTSPAPSSSAPDANAVVAAWQRGLAAEHAAVYAYAQLGPDLARADQALARAYESDHRAARDAAAAAIAAAGADPVASQPYYPPPFPLSDAAAAQRWALQLEEAGASAWRYLVAAAVAAPGDPNAGAARAAGQANLTACAVRALRWRVRVSPGQPTVPFPGIPS